MRVTDQILSFPSGLDLFVQRRCGPLLPLRQQALIRVLRSGNEHLPDHLNPTVAKQIAAFKAPAS